MDFFARQDQARRHTVWLILLFALAVLCTIAMVYVVVQITWLYVASDMDAADSFRWWRPTLFLVVTLITGVIVALGSLFKIAELASEGGAGIAVSLGGREVLPTTDNFFERRLRNVVEEMAIASGTPVPAVFVMERERGMNAFAAGHRPSEAVVAVSKGAMEALTRSELQGVVAHEFSHILNGDMALNLHLMGVLHGLMGIAMTGRVLVEAVGDSSRVSNSRSGKGGGIILLFGFALNVVGSIGVFYCRMIKACVSRTRERLADAAAVQFTRNPEGLGNALIKVGRIDTGSRIRNPRAEEVSHCFFATGIRLTGFATHPPLEQRIRWLMPSFDGVFTRASLEDLRREVGLIEAAPPEALVEEKPDVVDFFTNPTRAAVSAAILHHGVKRPQPSVQFSSPRDLLDQVGKPMQEHVDHARALIKSIPSEVRHHLEDAHGACTVIYWMLLDEDGDARSLQLDLLATRLEEQLLAKLNASRPMLQVLTPELRLPILDLALPALRTLSDAQYAEFRKVIDALVLVDGRISLTEFAVRKLLRHHLDPEFGLAPRRPKVNYYALRGLAQEASRVLTQLARSGDAELGVAREAFDAAVDSLRSTKGEYRWVETGPQDWEQLDEALSKLQTGSFKVKRWFLGAALVCMTRDRQMTLAEVELFRVIADLLDCPVPPWVAPTPPSVEELGAGSDPGQCPGA
jgi:Zn-dependent protease with chaperone function